MRLEKPHKHAIRSIKWYGQLTITVIPHVGKDRRKQIHLWDSAHGHHRTVIFPGDMDCPCADLF